MNVPVVDPGGGQRGQLPPPKKNISPGSATAVYSVQAIPIT